MLGNHKKAFFLVQLAAGLLTWIVYRNTRPLWGPSWVFLLSMEASAGLSVMWASRLRRNTPARSQAMLN
jgi:hypothetical protein